MGRSILQALPFHDPEAHYEANLQLLGDSIALGALTLNVSDFNKSEVSHYSQSLTPRLELKGL